VGGVGLDTLEGDAGDAVLVVSVQYVGRGMPIGRKLDFDIVHCVRGALPSSPTPPRP
jgi:hypothetical protein